MLSGNRRVGETGSRKVGVLELAERLSVELIFHFLKNRSEFYQKKSDAVKIPNGDRRTEDLDVGVAGRGRCCCCVSSDRKTSDRGDQHGDNSERGGERSSGTHFDYR